MRLSPTLSACALAALLVLAGCDAAPAPPDDARPDVIAPAAFELDLDLAAAAAATAGANHTNASLRVGIVSAIIGLNLVLPSAATHAATRTEPVVEDGVWVWESTFPIDGDDVTFRLEGAPAGRTVDWRLDITNRELDAFTLYTARTDLDGETGDWQLFHEERGERVEVLRADFAVTAGDARELVFSVPDGRDSGGSSVRYEADGDARAFDWREEPEGLDHLVEWDQATGAGSITADNYNGGVRACWDASLADAPCAETVAAR